MLLMFHALDPNKIIILQDNDIVSNLSLLTIAMNSAILYQITGLENRHEHNQCGISKRLLGK